MINYFNRKKSTYLIMDKAKGVILVCLALESRFLTTVLDLLDCLCLKPQHHR